MQNDDMTNFRDLCKAVEASYSFHEQECPELGSAFQIKTDRWVTHFADTGAYVGRQDRLTGKYTGADNG